MSDTALILVGSQVEDEAVRDRLRDWHDDRWGVETVSLGLDAGTAAETCTNALATTEPVIALFVGSAIGHSLLAPGDVLVARSVAILDGSAAEGHTPEPRAVAPEWLIQRVTRLTDRVNGANGEAPFRLQVGELAAGAGVATCWLERGPEWLWDRLRWARAVDTIGWDFLYARYTEPAPPVLVVYGVREEREGAAARAARNAATFALALLEEAGPHGLTMESRALRRPDVRVTVDSNLTVLEPQSALGAAPASRGIRRARHGRSGPATNAKDAVTPNQLDSLASGNVSPPPDLKLAIQLDAAAPALAFRVESPSGRLEVNEQEIGIMGLKQPAEDYRSDLRDRMRELTTGTGEHGVTLMSLGRRLFKELFPAELKTLYSQRRQRIETREREDGPLSLQIISDEPWIPWELVLPNGEDAEGDYWEDEYLCTRFALTRWLPGEGFGPKQRFEIGSMVSLEAGSPPMQSELEGAGEECVHLVRLLTERSVFNRSPRSVCHDKVMEIIDESAKVPVELWHVAAHGEIDPEHLERSAIILADGSSWTAEHIDSVRANALSKGRPLVFFNACLIAQQGMGLTGLTGWPRTWIEDCRCGAFIGPQWVVNSKLAAAFSRVFYGSLAEGRTLGEAALTGRRALRTAREDDPAFLAYCVFGHPNATVKFGQRPGAPQAVAA